jgi:hypothetical protein
VAQVVPQVLVAVVAVGRVHLVKVLIQEQAPLVLVEVAVELVL